ncbi:Cytosol aminopeptidase family, N-terminal domain [Filimonas lacunae]|uniref:Cytosol aminopeptidase family, N-terminal domain n=2 Tax=Filimonas lacunae TaxID=477680 RepID=A0A173MFT0_9BACT|nr:cytosol aminopeptidase [Filimonas lacunae]SIT27118.1 Cytosol aminopeptidase family, N-terminal domain [Filimonas lacunae]
MNHLLLAGFLAIAASNVQAQAVKADSAVKTTAIGTTKVWGTVDGMAIAGLVQGPSAAEAPLQVACVFEYTEGDIFNAPPALPAPLNGMVHLDHALQGQITEIRKSGKFAGHAFETLLITPPAGALKAQRLLLIGLGNRNAFNADLMTSVGAVALREALNLGVTSFSFASDIKDAGIDSPTALVAGNVTKGIIQAYRTQQYLKSKNLATYKPVTKVILLAGPAFFTTAGEGIKEAIASFNN